MTMPPSMIINADLALVKNCILENSESIQKHLKDYYRNLKIESSDEPVDSQEYDEELSQLIIDFNKTYPNIEVQEHQALLDSTQYIFQEGAADDEITACLVRGMILSTFIMKEAARQGDIKKGLKYLINSEYLRGRFDARNTEINKRKKKTGAAKKKTVIREKLAQEIAKFLTNEIKEKKYTSVDKMVEALDIVKLEYFVEAFNKLSEKEGHGFPKIGVDNFAKTIKNLALDFNELKIKLSEVIIAKKPSSK